MTFSVTFNGSLPALLDDSIIIRDPALSVLNGSIKLSILKVNCSIFFARSAVYPIVFFIGNIKIT